jgi:hypothetical protein
MIYYILRHSAGNIVTKRSGSLGGGGGVGARAATGFFWKSLGSMEQDYFGILSFQPKIFRLKLLIIEVSNQMAWPFMFQG